MYCTASAGLSMHRGGRELVAAWMLSEVPECVAVPCAVVHHAQNGVAPAAAQGGVAAAQGGVAAAMAPNGVAAGPSARADVEASTSRWALTDGTLVDCVVEIENEKAEIFDGKRMVKGRHDGVSSAHGHDLRS